MMSPDDVFGEKPMDMCYTCPHCEGKIYPEELIADIAIPIIDEPEYDDQEAILIETETEILET